VSSTPLRLRYAAMSDLGRHRKDNQDSGYASGNLLVIADGVGGAAYGDVASSTAVQILRRLDESPPAGLVEALAGAIHRVHDRLAELVEHDPELDGTSTTITAALFDGGRIGMAHVGDSRGYLLRHAELTRLTKDHTFVQTLVDEGRITEAESRNHPHRNLILRAVDGIHDTEPDLFDVPLEPGDRLLLCSDGCSGALDDQALARLLGKGTVDLAAAELVRGALDAGTTDNVTVIVADVVADVVAEEGTATDGTGQVTDADEPLVVGAAAAPPRKLHAKEGRHFFWHRGGDTGELEAVAEEPVDPEEVRYAPRPPRRFTWLRSLALVALALVVLVVAGRLAYDWSQKQYFVSDDGTNVVIYRGLDVGLPGISMHSVEEASKVTLASLPDYRADQVRDGLSADSLDEARRIVRNIEGLATPCPTPTPTPLARASKQPTKKATTRPPARPTRTPGAGRTPSATPTPTPTPSRTPTRTPAVSPAPTLAPPDCVMPDGAPSTSPVVPSPGATP
jgi:PPM family protein phosphatase